MFFPRLWDLGVYPHFCDTRESPPLHWGLVVLSQQWIPFPTTLFIPVFQEAVRFHSNKCCRLHGLGHIEHVFASCGLVVELQAQNRSNLTSFAPQTHQVEESDEETPGPVASASDSRLLGLRGGPSESWLGRLGARRSGWKAKVLFWTAIG